MAVKRREGLRVSGANRRVRKGKGEEGGGWMKGGTVVN
jgi:hypothetical protein